MHTDPEIKKRWTEFDKLETMMRKSAKTPGNIYRMLKIINEFILEMTLDLAEKKRNSRPGKNIKP